MVDAIAKVWTLVSFVLAKALRHMPEYKKLIQNEEGYRETIENLRTLIKQHESNQKGFLIRTVLLALFSLGLIAFIIYKEYTL